MIPVAHRRRRFCSTHCFHASCGPYPVGAGAPRYKRWSVRLMPLEKMGERLERTRIVYAQYIHPVRHWLIVSRAAVFVAGEVIGRAAI